jgi:hypothetical protein
LARLSFAAFAVALLAPAPSFAAFTRPFLRQISSTTGEGFKFPRSVATGSADDLWVTEPGAGGTEPPYPLQRFDSAEHGNKFLETLEIKSPETRPTLPEFLAIAHTSGSFYITGQSWGGEYLNGHPSVERFDKAGTFALRFGPFPRPSDVAVDNSTEPSAGTVYVAEIGFENAIEKLSPSLVPVGFAGCGEECSKYVSGNRLTGTPSERFATLDRIAVDPHGDIFVVVNNGGSQRTPSVVDEFEPSGRFVRAFGGKETPGLGGDHTNGGYGGQLHGIAVDPVSGDVLVGVTNDEEHGIAAVDEFTSSGEYRGQIVATTAGHRLTAATALTVDSKGDLYVLNGDSNFPESDQHAVDVYGPGHLLASLTLAEASERAPTKAVLNGSVNPSGQKLSDCHFEYVTEAAFNTTGFEDLTSGGKATCVPVHGPIGADESFHEVEAKVTEHIESGVTYRFRLVATTEGALGGVAETAALAFTAPSRPRVDSTSAANLSSTFADLRATIDPLGAASSYQFQYLTQAAYAENGNSFEGLHLPALAPASPAAIGSGGPTGSAPEPVLQQIAGLQPATAYRFRVLATNELGTTPGAEVAFATLAQPSTGLPDGRAYELLTPLNKEGAEDIFAGEAATTREFYDGSFLGSGYPSESGNGFLLQTRAALGSFPTASNNAYTFTRTSSGWRYASLSSPALALQSLEVFAFNPFDFSRVALLDYSGSLASPAGSSPLSVAGPPGGPYTKLHGDAPEFGAEPPKESTSVVGASRDLTHLVLKSDNHTLDPRASALDMGVAALYESGGDAECSGAAENCPLIDVNSEGQLLSRCGAGLGQGFGQNGSGHGAVSADGSRVIFTAPAPEAVNKGAGCWNGGVEDVNSPQLYSRSGGVTTEISRPEPGAPEAPVARHPAVYAGASADGSRVFYFTQGELTVDDAGIHDVELYEWRSMGTSGPSGACPAVEGCLTRVSAGESGHAAAAVFTVPAVAAGGAAVYFTADGVLAGNQGADGSHASLGHCTTKEQETCNLYRYDTATGATAYIATVNESDVDLSRSKWWEGQEGPGAIYKKADALDSTADYYATPDGRHLLFGTFRQLTAYDNSAASCLVPGTRPNGRCRELYRYSYEPEAAPRGSLACVSCDPSSAPPVSDASFASDSPALNGAAASTIRGMSDDGRYVFFDTADPLVPTDTNGTLDVYEWHDGVVSLISSGHDAHPSFLLGSSPDGANVFFGTHARLVPQDTDDAGDLYDARICTESDPCITPPAGETAQCEGGACQSSPPPPLDASPGSLTFSGAGNLLVEAPAPPVTVGPTNAQRLAAALKLCRKRAKSQRKRCEAQAHRRYAKKARRSNHARHAKTSGRIGI